MSSPRKDKIILKTDSRSFLFRNQPVSIQSPLPLPHISQFTQQLLPTCSLFLSHFSMCLTPFPPPPTNLNPFYTLFPCLPSCIPPPSCPPPPHMPPPHAPPPHAPSTSRRCLPCRVNSIRYFSLCSRLTLYSVQAIFIF